MGDLGYFYSVNKIFDANQHKPFLHVHNFSGVGVKKETMFLMVKFFVAYLGKVLIKILDCPKVLI